jgi:hypothetical protein
VDWLTRMDMIDARGRIAPPAVSNALVQRLLT